MGKNALVLDDHYGDNGAVTAGMILRNITDTRFKELEKKQLVREATAAELKAGDQHAFEKDNTGADDGGQKNAPDPSNKKAPDPKSKDA